MGEVNNAFVCLLGIGTIFFGLICLIFICMITGKLCTKFTKKPAETNVSAPVSAAPAAAAGDNQAVVAAISAAIAEQLGTDVSKIRILTIR